MPDPPLSVATLHFVTARIISAPIVLSSLAVTLSGRTVSVLLLGHHFDCPPPPARKVFFDSDHVFPITCSAESNKETTAGKQNYHFLCTIVQRSQVTALFAENILIFNRKALSVRGYRTTWPLSYYVFNVSVWNIFYWPLQVVMQTGRIEVDKNNSQLAQKVVWPLPVVVRSLRTTSKIS